jgi:choice-of-anchor B domain-containing protein
MLKYILSAFIFVSIVQFSAGQLNIDSISHLNYQQLHQTDLNDIWGYVDETGVEYALVGAQKGSSVVSLEDPENPIEVFWEPGMESVWRDLKTWQDYAYITTEAENGLLIIDLSPLPSSTALTTSYYYGESGSNWSSAHNIYIDENGYAYIFGMNRGNGGVIILDVHTDPMNPVEVGEFDMWYVHDGYVRNDTMYLAHIEEGFLSIVDVSDKANPVLLGTKTTPSNFTHNIWPSDNSQFAFTTDEVSGAYLGAYNVTDPDNIYEVDRIQSSPGAGVIPHNVHVLGNYLITSYYSDGVTVHDITHPHNMVEVGHYDTYPLQTTSYDGCWGAYPFLPSGILLATDITQGLFILGPNYLPAAYLEGVATEEGTGNPVANVQVQLQGHNQIDFSIMNGAYATGIIEGGNYTANYSKVGYYPQSHSVTLVNGEIAIKDVQLVPIPPFNFTVNVVEEGTGNPINNADVRLIADLITHEGVTNGVGQEDFVLYYQEEYNVVVGKWSFVTVCFDTLIDENTTAFTVELPKGYYDDFEFDFGWISSGNATTGQWERGKPFATSSGSNPGFDADFDCGDKAYVTGNQSALHPDIDDVDGGTAILISPTMDLTSYSDPHINFARWFYCMHGAPAEDTMKILISNGFATAKIDFTGHDAATELTWVSKSIRLLDHISITSSMQMIVRVPDLDPDVNITEGGLDYFFISNQNVAEESELSVNELTAYPNPVSDQLKIKGATGSGNYLLLDLNGRIVETGSYSEAEFTIDLSDLNSGCYMLQIGQQVLRVLKD